MSYTLIKTHLEGSAAYLRLNGDDRLNVIGQQLADEVTAALAESVAQGARVVVLQANPGVKVWSAGFDVTELPPAGEDPLQPDAPLPRLVRAIQTCPLPVIVCLEGSVWGGACELVLACDLVLAMPEVTLALTPARMGVAYGPEGMLNFLGALPLALLKEMLFSARPVGADRLLVLGVFNYVLPQPALNTVCEQLVADIASTAPLAVMAMKETLRTLVTQRGLSSARADTGPEALARIQALRHQVLCSEDYREGVAALKMRRKPLFQGK